MVVTSATPIRATVWFATVCLAMLAFVGVASAAPTVPGLTSSTGSPTNKSAVTFNWGAAVVDPGFTFLRFEGGVTPGDAPVNPGFGYTPGGDGTVTFRVRAVEVLDPALPVEVPGPYATVSVLFDRTPPKATVTLLPGSPNGQNGWYTNAGSGLRIVTSCAGDATALSGCGTTTWTAQRANPAGTTITVRDAAGNVSQFTSPAFKYDAIAPTPRGLLTPGVDAKLGAEPTYTWTRFDDGTSGTSRYEVQYKLGGTASNWPGSPSVLAMVGQPAGNVTTVSTARNVLTTPLPAGQDVWWRVRTYDNAGNSSLTSARKLRIDPSAPAPPAISGGPAGPTNSAAPSFSWSGTSGSYKWDVTGAGEDTAAQSGSGPATSVTLKPLPDGDYTFRVSQLDQFGTTSSEATRNFSVDTVAPAAPVITRRPTFPTTNPAVFAWSIEPGAYGRYAVVGGGGAVVRGPSDAPSGSVALAGLANGAYSFQVTAIDPAGNLSSTISDPFSITGSTSSGKSTSQNTLLPKLNASRLRPKAGRTLSTLRPVLHWVKGPRGTTLYNVQLFRVGRKASNGQRVVTKVVSVFPKATSYTLSKKMSAGTCYIWRVWPYLGTKFADKPLGISNFCIASKKILRAKAVKAAKAAKARAAAGKRR